MMRKWTPRLLLIAMTLVMTFCLVSCGEKKGNGKDTNRKENDVKQENSSENEGGEADKDEEKEQEKKDSLYESVADYVNSDEMQAALNTLKSSLQEGMNIDLVAEGENKLVYIFTYQTIAHTEGDGMTENLEAAVGAQDAVFQQTANSVKPFVGSDQVLVEIRYVDMNGAVIFSKTYTSE